VILAEHFRLRFFIEGDENKVLNRENTIHPGTGCARLGDCVLYVEEKARVAFEAAVSSRAQHLEQVRSMEVIDRLRRDIATLVRCGGASAQYRLEITGAGHERVGRRSWPVFMGRHSADFTRRRVGVTQLMALHGARSL
jgi:hypothetical protein